MRLLLRNALKNPTMKSVNLNATKSPLNSINQRLRFLSSNELGDDIKPIQYFNMMLSNKSPRAGNANHPSYTSNSMLSFLQKFVSKNKLSEQDPEIKKVLSEFVGHCIQGTKNCLENIKTFYSANPQERFNYFNYVREANLLISSGLTIDPSNADLISAKSQLEDIQSRFNSLPNDENINTSSSCLSGRR